MDAVTADGSCRLRHLTGLALVLFTGACTGQIGGADASPVPVGIDADGDGTIDGFDSNGDGVIDDAGVDVDGDGVVDVPGATSTSSTSGTATSTTTGGALPVEPPLDNDPDAIAAACAAKAGVVDVGRTRLRRLTRDQFNNTVGVLIGATGEPASAISPDERIGPFHSNAITPIDSLMVEQHQEVAALLAADAQARMADLTPCDLTTDTGTTCATQFIETLGLGAYRRPLEASEVSKYLALYQLGADASGAQHGFRLVLEAMLQSPFFLYHLDLGQNTTPSATPVPVTAYELASRLSYFLWNSMPDATLFERAAQGDIVEETTLAAQVERMLADAKAGPTIALFHRQWLGLEELPSSDKDAAAFPGYGPELVNAMLEETGTFSDYVIRQGDGLLNTLFTASFSFPSGGLFAIYGVPEPAGFSPGTLVNLDPNQRAGILTQPAFLARHAHRDQTSPVHRGLVIRENLLCQLIDPPPANVNTTPPAPSAATSTRERFAQHSADSVCGNCHQLMDPIGLGLENFDAIGAWRTEDGLGPVDASGNFSAVASDLAGDFNGALELASKLAQSSEVQSCVANQWFRFALGRVESQSDACSMQAIHEGFQESGGNIRTLMANIALSEAFRYVRSVGAEEGGP